MAGAASHWSSELIGVTLGRRYQIEGLIGAGGMGAVFRGVHQGMGRQVAIKLLIPEFRQHPKAIKRFQIEAKAAASTNRRGVVDVLDYDVDQTHGPYLVMELLEGESLEQRLGRLGGLEPADALTIAIEILDTLDAVHDHGIVHRDLKPANIFLARTEEGEELVKVLDFGISRVDSADRQTKLTTPGMAVGTPRYMAPEQAQCDPDVDFRADLYSVGAILYEALSGRKPYEDIFPGQVLSEVILRAPQPFSEVTRYSEPSLVALVERAMSREREARYESARAMSAELVELRREVVGSSSVDNEPPTVVDQGRLSSIVSEAKARADETPRYPDQPSSPRPAAPRRREDVPSWPSEPPRTPTPVPLGSKYASNQSTSGSVDGSARVSPSGATPEEKAISARPGRRWWLPLVIMGGVIVLLAAVGGGFLAVRHFRASSATASASGASSASVPSMPQTIGGAPSQPQANSGALSQPGVVPSTDDGEAALRSELEAARAERSEGSTAAAESRLNALIQRAHHGGAQPETNEGSIVSEAHIMLCELLTNRIAAPSRPQPGVDFGATQRAMTTPFTEATQHATQAARMTAGFRQCAAVCQAQAEEQLGDAYLRMHASTEYRATLAPQIITFISEAGTRHLTSARGHYDRALQETNSGCAAEATAGRLRVEARLAGARLSNMTQ